MVLCLEFLPEKIKKIFHSFHKASSVKDDVEKELESKIKDNILHYKKSFLVERKINKYKGRETLKSALVSYQSAKEYHDKTTGGQKVSNDIEKQKTKVYKYIAKLEEEIEAEKVHERLKNYAQLDIEERFHQTIDFDETLSGLLEGARSLSSKKSAEKQIFKTVFAIQAIMKYSRMIAGQKFGDKLFPVTFHNPVSDLEQQEKRKIAEQIRKLENEEQKMMTKRSEAAVPVLESHSHIFPNDETSERRQGRPFPDRERWLEVRPNEGDENEYDNLLTFLKNRPNSFSSNSLEKEPSLLQGETVIKISYSDRPKFRVRMNEITSDVFESAMKGVFADSNVIEYIPIHLEDCRMFLLFPVYKGGALHRHEMKQNNKQ